jgi:hypothetical protein
LLILAVVIQQVFFERSDLDWQKNFYVALYPVNADDSDRVNRYIKTLKKRDFEGVESFFTEEAERYACGGQLLFS